MKHTMLMISMDNYYKEKNFECIKNWPTNSSYRFHDIAHHVMVIEDHFQGIS